MEACYEVKNADLKAIGFAGFIKATLDCMENGRLTIVMQDNHAIQINRCEKYTLDDYIEEVFNLEEALEV